MKNQIFYAVLVVGVLLFLASTVYAVQKSFSIESIDLNSAANGPNPQILNTASKSLKSLNVLPSDKIEQSLSKKIGKARPQDTIKILIKLVKNPGSPIGNIKGLSKDKVARAVIGNLKSSAQNSQKNVLDYLLSNSVTAKSVAVKSSASKSPSAGKVKTYKAYWAVNYIAAQVNPDVVASIAALPDVVAVYEDKAVEPPTPMDFQTQIMAPAPNTMAWGVKQIRANKLWNPDLTGGMVTRNDFIQLLSTSSINGGEVFDWLLSKFYLQEEGVPDEAYVKSMTNTIIQAIQQSKFSAQADSIISFLQRNQGQKIDGTGVIVGIIDTGVDATHPSLFGKMATGLLGWKDFNADSATPVDTMGHGTHVTGIILGTNNNSLHIDIGVAPGAMYYAARIFGLNTTTNSMILDAAQWMIDPDTHKVHPDIINCSWGASDSTDDWFREMVQTWRNLGILPVFAAGNNQARTPSYNGFWSLTNPGSYPEAFSVGANDSLNQIANFSSEGPSTFDGLEGIIKPDATAPGVNIVSAWATGTDMYGDGQHGVVGTNLYLSSGTSMAAPHVAGAAALLKQMHPDWSPDDLQAALSQSRDYSDTPTGLYSHGTGRSDAFMAARVTMIFEPSAISFGRADNSTTSWNKSTLFTIKNMTPKSESYALSCHNSFPLGINCQVSPQQITVPAMSEAQASLSIRVDNTKAMNVQGFPNSYSGNVLAISSGNEYHSMPFSFLKSPVLYISRTYTPTQNFLKVLNDSGFVANFSTNIGSSENVIVNVPRDDISYDIFNLEMEGDTVYISTYDQVKPNNLNSPVLINKADAVHSLKISPVDINNNPLTLDYRELLFRSAQNNSVGIDYYQEGKSPWQLKFSNISPRWKVDWFLQTAGLVTYEDGMGSVKDYYAINGEISDGIFYDIAWSNNPLDFNPMTLRFHPLSGVSSIGISFGMRISGAPADIKTLQSPFLQKFYVQKASQSDFHFFSHVDTLHSLLITPPNGRVTCPSPYDPNGSFCYSDWGVFSPIFSATSPNTFEANLHGISNPMRISSDGTWDVGLGPYFFAGSLNYVNNTIVLMPLNKIGNLLFSSQNFDEIKNEINSPVVNLYNSSGALIATYPIYSAIQPISVPSPGKYSLQIPGFKEYSIGSMNGSSSVSMNFDTTMVNNVPPQFTQLNIFSNKHMTNMVNGKVDGNMITFTINDASPITEVVVRYKTINGHVTGTLAVTGPISSPRLAGNEYMVLIPKNFIATNDYVSLVITAVDKAGNSTAQNLNPAFYYESAPTNKTVRTSSVAIR